MRPIKQLSNVLLLICEGANTEPEYFKKLADISVAAGVYSNIEVYPKPKEEQTATGKANTNSGRPLRQFSRAKGAIPDRTVDPADDDEKGFMTLSKGVEIWATPIRYIKEARDRMKTGAYNEAWAIYDMDGHPAHEKATQLAAVPLDDQTINIAFSAISFEHWVLLHFEKSGHGFEKAECKEDKKPIDCGTGRHMNDCGGTRCVSGRLISKGYLNSYSKSSNSGLYELISNRTLQAVENAAWLWGLQQENLEKDPLWKINPITTLDVLVKKMLNIPVTFLWLQLNSALEANGVNLTLIESDGNFHLLIRNKRHYNLSSNELSVELHNSRQLSRLNPPVIITTNEKKVWVLGPIASIDRAEIRYENFHILFEKNALK